MDPFYHYTQPGDNISRPHGHPNQSTQNPHHPNNASVPPQPLANNYGARSVPPQYGVLPPSQQPHAGQTSHRHQQHQQSQHARPPSSQYTTGQPLQQAQGTRGVYPYSSGQPAPTMNAPVPQPTYAVPNPLGANGNGGDKRVTNQKELLRSMYHQSQQIQQQRPPSHPSPAQMPPNPSPSLQASQTPSMAGYRAPAQGVYQQTSQPSAMQVPGNVHTMQHPQQQRAPSYQQNYQNSNQAVPPQQPTQVSYIHNRSSGQTPSYSQGQAKAPQQRHAQLQSSSSSQQQIHQNYQMQQMQQKQYNQSSMRSAPQLHSTQQQQQQQQKQQQQLRSTQQPHPQPNQQTTHPSQHHHHQQPKLHQQQSQQQSQQKQKQRFNLTPEAKHALRDAVLSAIRSPTGQIDPMLLQRAMEKGLPKHAIMNAALVAKERDRKNKAVRVDQSQSSSHNQNEQHHQQQQSQQQVSSVHISSESGRVHPSMPAGNNNQQVPRPSSNNSSTYQTHQQQHYTYHQQQQQQHQQPQQQQKKQHHQQQQQQQIYKSQTQHDPPVLQKQYEQQLLEKQQQKLQQERVEAQRQAEIKAAAVAAAKKKKQQEEEDRRKRQKIELQRQAQKEQQKRLMEEEKKRKEVEAANALKAAESKRVAELRAQVKPWGRTSSALVAKKDAAAVGGGNVASVGSLSPGAPHPHSYWGGTSRCKDTTPALLCALQQQKNEMKSKQLKASVNINKVKSFANQLRRNLIYQNTLPAKKDEEDMSEDDDEPAPLNTRKRRLAAIATSLLEPERLKRYKLQPKREGKFLEKHIRRARTITADATSRRHKDLLKAITNHQTEFYKFHRLKKTDAARLARAIRDQLNKEEKQREKEADQAERARIAALRANDMTAYTSLLEDTKNERLKFLLDKTDECMNQISSLLTSRAEEEEEEIRKAGGEGKMKATFSEAPTGGSYYDTAHVKSEQVRQPSILVGGDLKEYQLSGLQWLVSLYNNRLNGILADEMGLGKTIQTISLIAYLIEVKENLGPYLVIVPLSTLSNWVNEFAKWLPAATVVCYKGTPQQRKDIFRNEVADGHFNVLLTTYEFVIRDKGSLRKLTWQYAIVDEGHRMKNNQSKFAVTLGTHYNTRRRVLLTGTPLQNSLPELWALLNFLLPSIFNSAETFDQWFNKPFSSFGKSNSAGPEGADNSSEELLSNEERMLIIHRLHELLRPFMLRRVKSEVLDQLPEKVEKVIRCELSSWQKELYKQISHKIVGEAQSKNFNRGLNNVVMQLRKVVNHPYLFSKEGYHINEDIIRTSGKMELLDRMLPKLKAAGHRVLMFTQMTKMMPILEDYFAYRGFSSLRLDGSTTADEREKRMYMFNAPDSPYFVFLLSTRAGGLGLNLATADTVIIFDSDWNPMMDLQAQDRAHRIGQRKDVRVFRIISQSPVEEKILSRATEKLHMNELVVEAGKFDRSGGGEDSSSLERLKMMEILLTDFDSSQYASQNNCASNSEDDFEKYNDDGDGENSGDLLNEMISSNDDDYNLYCKIDLANNSRPMLYSDIKDVPDWILYPNGKPEEGIEVIDPVAGGLPSKRRAAAGDIVYDDGLTEKQFCRLMDKKASEEEKGKKKRKKKRSRNAVDPSLIIADDGGRKRSKTSPNDSSIISPQPKTTAASAGLIIDKSGEVTPTVNERLISICRSIIYYKEKGTNRKMSEIFLEKPCPTTYPDYYQLIEKPIGMNDILRKCRAKLYTSIGSFMDDWNTLFKNAVTYNGEGSWIVIDGNHLKKELYRYMEKNNLTTTPTSKKPLRIKLSLKAKKKTEGGEGGKQDSVSPRNEATLELKQNPPNFGNGSDSDSDTESGGKYSDLVGVNEREPTPSKRGKIKSGGLGSRGGNTRLVRK